MIKSDVAIINQVGFDGGGISKLGIEYSKLGFDVYFKDVIQPLQFKPECENTIRLYNKNSDLVDIISKYKRIIFLPFTFELSLMEKRFCEIIEICKKFSNIEFCYIYCTRKIEHLKVLCELQNKYEFKFNKIFTLSPRVKGMCDNIVCTNINAYSFPKFSSVSLEDKSNIILTAGRVEGVKGVLSYFNSISDDFLDGDYTYIHEGAKFKYNKNGNISVSPQLFCLFEQLTPKKIVKDTFEFNQYDDFPVADRVTIYPSYSLDRPLKYWPYYYAGICCILGTKNPCIKQTTFLGTNWIISNKTENTRITNQLDLWNDDLEYTTLEMIASGIPVFFSRNYAEILNYHDDRVIYSCFSDIPKMIDLGNCYDEIRTLQYKIFKNKCNPFI